MLVAAVAGGLILIVSLLVFGLIFRGNGNADSLISLTQQQNEIVRIATLGSANASGSARSFSTTTQLAVQSDQTLLLANLKANRHSVAPKILIATKNARIDAILAKATQENSYDETVTATLKTALLAYKDAVKKAYDAESSPKTKKILSDSYNHAATLAK